MTKNPGSIEFVPSASDAPVFLLACSQRSGSTFLQRLLNSHPNILIWGEHDGYVNHLYDGYISLRDWKRLHRASGKEFVEKSTVAFMPNAMADFSYLTAAFQAHLRGLFPIPTSRAPGCAWGFKEVRYDIWTAIFLQDLFPQARFIHLVRNIDSCLGSMRRLEARGDWQSVWTTGAIANWIRINESFAHFSDRLDSCLRVKYEDLVGVHSAKTTSSIESFLGLQSGSLDRQLFKQRVDLVEVPYQWWRLTDEDRTILNQPQVVALKEKYGY